MNHSIFHSLVMGSITGIAAGAICIVFSKPVLKISGADPVILEYTMPYYLAVAAPCVILCLQLILSSCLRAIKDTRTPMYVTGVFYFRRNLGIRIGAGYLLAKYFELGLIGVWCAYAFDVMLRGILLLGRYQKGAWQKINL